MEFENNIQLSTKEYDVALLKRENKICHNLLNFVIIILGGDHMIPVSRDEILSRFVGIPAVL